MSHGDTVISPFIYYLLGFVRRLGHAHLAAGTIPVPLRSAKFVHGVLYINGSFFVLMGNCSVPLGGYVLLTGRHVHYVGNVLTCARDYENMITSQILWIFRKAENYYGPCQYIDLPVSSMSAKPNVLGDAQPCVQETIGFN